jgi:hypothetical protein
MHSLRKRAKLESIEKTLNNDMVDFDFLPNLTEKCVTTNQNNSFDQLPIELYYCLFDNLNIKDLMKMRQLNKKFKTIFDNCIQIWKYRIKIKASLTNQRETKQLSNMIKECKFIDMIEVASAKYFNPASQADISPNNYFTLYLTTLNVFTIDNLKPFLVNCTNICIDSFYAHSHSIATKNQIYYKTSRLKKIRLDALTTFHISCKCFDKRNSRYFNVEEIENFLYVFKNFQMDNLTYLKLSCYRQSFDSLVTNLSNLMGLTYLEFEECMVDSIEITPSSKSVSRIRPKFVHFYSCTVLFCRLVLDNIVDLNYIEYLSLFDHQDCVNYNTKSNDCDNHEQADLLSHLDSKMPKLFEFKTNFCTTSFKHINFRYSTIKLNLFLINRFSTFCDQSDLNRMNYSLANNMKSKFALDLRRLNSRNLYLNRFSYLSLNVFYDLIKNYFITNRICYVLNELVLELNMNCHSYKANKEDDFSFTDCLCLLAKKFSNLKRVLFLLKCSNSTCFEINSADGNKFKAKKNYETCKLKSNLQPGTNYFLKDFYNYENEKPKFFGCNIEFKINFAFV